MRITSRRVGAFSQREMVGCEQRSGSAVGQPSARQLEGGVAAEPVEVVAIGIAATDRQHATAQHIATVCLMCEGSRRSAMCSGKCLGDVAAALGQRQQHHAAVGGQPASIKRGCDFPARNRWQAKATWQNLRIK